MDIMSYTIIIILAISLYFQNNKVQLVERLVYILFRLLNIFLGSFLKKKQENWEPEMNFYLKKIKSV